jgi:rRNA maturation RNase YbeY
MAEHPITPDISLDIICDTGDVTIPVSNEDFQQLAERIFTPEESTSATASLSAIQLPALTKPLLIELTLTDNATILQLNEQYRHKAQATDVLSFPTFESYEEALNTPSPIIPLGAIVISVEWALENAGKELRTKDYSQPVNAFILDRFIHGCLHISGHHHDTMETFNEVVALQKDILDGFFMDGFSNG